MRSPTRSPRRSPSCSPTKRPSPPAPAWSATAAIRSSLLLALALLAGCGSEPEPQAPPPQALVSAAACERREFEGSAFTACRYDADAHRIELLLDGAQGPLRSLAALEAHLGERAGRLRFAMNAGMYDEDGIPIGLYVEEGDRRRPLNLRDGPGNFHMKPNGVFQVDGDGRVAIVRSEEAGADGVRWATQSGPLLVIEERLHPRIQPNGDSLKVRNGVGVADPDTAWFAISEEPVSFGRFARFFRDSLGCSDALYLDGTVSSLWDRPGGRQDGYSSLGPMVAVFDRAPPP